MTVLSTNLCQFAHSQIYTNDIQYIEVGESDEYSPSMLSYPTTKQKKKKVSDGI